MVASGRRQSAPPATATRRTWIALAAFVLSAWTFTWVLYWAAPPEGGPLADGMRVLSGFGPSLAAVGVVASAGGLNGIRRLVAPLTRWRLGWSWYVGPLLGPPLVMGAGVGAYLVAGGSGGSTENDPGCGGRSR